MHDCMPPCTVHVPCPTVPQLSNGINPAPHALPQDLLRMQRGLPPAAFEEGFDGSAWVAAVREADSTVVLRRLLGEVSVGGMREAGWVAAHMMLGRETCEAPVVQRPAVRSTPLMTVRWWQRMPAACARSCKLLSCQPLTDGCQPGRATATLQLEVSVTAERRHERFFVNPPLVRGAWLPTGGQGSRLGTGMASWCAPCAAVAHFLCPPC